MAAESRMGRKIPEPYREFLKSHNGTQPDPGNFRMELEDTGLVGEELELATVSFFLGIDVQDSLNIERFVETFEGRLPDGYLPFARAAGGNLLCIATGGEDEGKIYFWDHEQEAGEGEEATTENLFFVAADFDQLLESFAESP